MDCCVCHKKIADCWPPVCDDKDCEYWFKVECNYNHWAREQANRDLDNLELDKHETKGG